jgi:hypothetical protein
MYRTSTPWGQLYLASCTLYPGDPPADEIIQANAGKRRAAAEAGQRYARASKACCPSSFLPTPGAHDGSQSGRCPAGARHQQQQRHSLPAPVSGWAQRPREYAFRGASFVLGFPPCSLARSSAARIVWPSPPLAPRTALLEGKDIRCQGSRWAVCVVDRLSGAAWRRRGFCAQRSLHRAAHALLLCNLYLRAGEASAERSLRPKLGSIRRSMIRKSEAPPAKSLVGWPR